MNSIIISETVVEDLFYYLLRCILWHCY